MAAGRRASLSERAERGGADLAADPRLPVKPSLADGIPDGLATIALALGSGNTVGRKYRKHCARARSWPFVSNPDRGPYWWLGWSNKTGAQLLPNVSAPALHQLLDAVEAEVLANDDSLSRFVPPRTPSPWLHENGEWWPKAD